MASPLFTGADSLRDPRERLAFVLTLVFALPMAYLIGTVIHEQIGPPEVALFIVIAMLYVTLARGRLIGSSIMIHEAQYPRVFDIVKEICARLDIAMPLIFVREDNNVPVAALGFGEPYSLVLSSHWIEHFEDDELTFAIGRELGHVAAGHTRFLSLLSVNGNENPVVSLIFGGWLRTCTRTCDKVGLVACGSLDAAIRSITISAFHSFGRHVDLDQFAVQGRGLSGDGALRWGEWLGGEPYATRRIAMLRTFSTSPLYTVQRSWYDRPVAPEPPALADTAGVRVARADCAGPMRRLWSIVIDVSVVGLLLYVFTHTNDKAAAAIGDAVSSTTKGMPAFIAEHRALAAILGGFIGTYANATFFVVWIYLCLLVGFAGQSFGMMITGLRVVTTDFHAPGLGRSIWRYFVGWTLWPVILCCSFFMPRVMLHDRLSGTRLIRGEKIMARAASAATNYSNG
jgi:uncharacterized RDD family membrane protein YckC